MEKEESALGGLSIEYTKPDKIKKEAVDAFSECMARLWKVHPFREGNTRTIVTFCCEYAKTQEVFVDLTILRDNSSYMRTALVAASAKFSDLGDLSQTQHLRVIMKDAMDSGMERQIQKISQRQDVFYDILKLGDKRVLEEIRKLSDERKKLEIIQKGDSPSNLKQNKEYER